MRTGSSLSHVAISLLESPSEVLGLSMSSRLWVRWGQGKVTLPGGMGFVKVGPKSQKARAPSMKQGPGWCSASVPRGSLCGQTPVSSQLS